MSTTPNYTAADALKYAAALLKSCTDWSADSIAGSCCEHGHEDELDAINDTVTEIASLAGQFGDPRRYSDGRRVEQSAAIQNGLVTSHIWHFDTAVEQPTSWRSALPHDPGEPSPGFYEVSLDPMTQGIHVCVVRAL